MAHIKKIFTLNEKEDFERYSIFKEYAIFGDIDRTGKPHYYILKNRGNECQQIYYTIDQEVKKANSKYYYKPDIYKLFNEFIIDSDTVDEVLEELDMLLNVFKYNI